MNAADRFRSAIEAGDFDAAVAEFTDDIRFFSPVKFTPFEGIDTVRALFQVLQRTFEDFRYVGDFPGRGQTPDGDDAEAHVLHFRTVVSGKQVEGIDLIHVNDGDRISTFTVMIRPMSSLQAVSEAIYAGLVADGVLSG
ncbi:nuclear transport factor 2 family protein [Saccharopolyspora rhizosphaerae]|uniref:Nuclear transport factor 2 family protein n=1 Tax=Saccharopolyspora rhizosphaerae TaxID=2492662 RepID=A0A3R8P567_9PSEU|nr:nuclear transport factor 2 family protein [Saccharopolyspora rhizosphaerae]RRO20370.1 nuclear transport factor 2 family protein [Saccharopolyspora rhizosphaerae]